MMDDKTIIDIYSAAWKASNPREPAYPVVTQFDLAGLRGLREAAIQECADAITATGAKLSTSINESAVSAYYSSAEICRQLKDRK